VVVQFLEDEDLTTTVNRTLNVVHVCVFSSPGNFRRVVVFDNKWRVPLGVETFDVLKSVSNPRSRVSANVGQRLTSSISYSPASFIQPQKGQSTALSSAIFVEACRLSLFQLGAFGCQRRRVPS